MKTVQSIDELKAHALRNGASVELGGSRFNTERTRVNTPSFRTPAPVSGSHNDGAMQAVVMAMAQQLAATQASQQQGYEVLAAAIAQAVAKAQAPTVNVEAAPPAVHVAASKFPELPQAPRKWSFAIERDDEGRMTSITASAH